MKRVLFWLSIFILFHHNTELSGQQVIKNSSITGITYAGNKVNRIYIPPPKNISFAADSKRGGKINVIYTGFPSGAQAAFDYAVRILEYMLPGDLNMTVRASWTRISSDGVLGNSSITGFAGGWAIDAFEPVALYPVTVAEKIAGRSLNEEFEADVELVLNSTANWYLGTDGNTPVTKYDLVTVVLHELCHGLGFFDSMNAENNIGSYGIGNIPIIYDRFVENLLKERLTDTILFDQDSEELYNELTGEQLYFEGPLTRRYLSGGRARLYAPSTFDAGSSIAHLDELRTIQADALMTPFIDLGEAIHDPGRLTMSILGDLGWINTRIIPEELNDTEENLSQLEINAFVVSDTLYNRDLVGFVYSYDDFQTSDTILMSSSASDDSYTAIVQIPSYNTKLDYYYFASDDFLRIFRNPSLAEKDPYTVYIGTDTVKPIISHSPSEYYFEKIDSITFNANVVDNLGVDTVYIEYRINEGSLSYYGLDFRGSDDYWAKLDVRPAMLKGGDSLLYRIIAVDKASIGNIAFNPSSGYHKIGIERILEDLTSYLTDFSGADADFFNSGFSIDQPEGFSSAGMHSEHPYKSPDEDNKTLEFSTVLRHPVMFDPTGMIISLRELVLVEPGEEGSVYGLSDFYDYVILEASGDYGRSWFELTDGYDSRIIPSWEEAYNSSIEGNNSTFEGKESMMVTRTFFPELSQLITDRDTLLIRFRLFSDPYANGWGWVFDDLVIKPLVDNIDEPEFPEIRIFPNPGNGQINIRTGKENGPGLLQVRIFNLTGRRLYSGNFSGEEIISVDISGNPPGIYLILLNDGHTDKAFKYNLIK